MEIIPNLFIFVNKKMIDRIKKLLEIKQLSPSQFADEIGLQRSSLSHVLSGRNKPSLDFVMKIKQRFSEINLDWLVFGTGEMEQKKLNNDLEKNDISIHTIETSDQQSINFDPKPTSPNSDKDEIYSEVKTRIPFGMSSKASKVILIYENGTFEEFTNR